MRIPIIAGNWKMNNTLKEGIRLIEDIKSCDISKEVESVICVPYTLLTESKKILENCDIKLGAQNMHYEDRGAYTGEISPEMLKEIGVDYVIIGHSERRQYFAETDSIINKKLKAAFNYDIIPILCVGEVLEEREEKIQESVVNSQLERALAGIEAAKVKEMVIAYEPVWAIGTGKTASAEDANNMLISIRKKIEELYDKSVAEEIRLQYGGSVNPGNIEELMDKSDVDGALVGGASLKAQDFISLINF